MNKVVIKIDEYGLRHNEQKAYNVLLKYLNVVFELGDLSNDLDECDFSFCDLDLHDPDNKIYNAMFENMNDQITVDCFIDIYMQRISENKFKITECQISHD